MSSWHPHVQTVREGCGHHACRGHAEFRYVPGLLQVADDEAVDG